MSKYFTRGLLVSFIVATVFVSSLFINTKPASAQSTDMCSLVNLLITIGVIPADRVDMIRSTFNCSTVTPAVPPTATSTQPSITVLSPNGGETIKIGDKYKIKYNIFRSKAGPSLVDARYSIYLVDDSTSCAIGLTGCQNNFYIASVGFSKNYLWDTNKKMSGPSTGPDSVSVRPGVKYKIKICKEGDSSVCDISNSYFTIVSPTIAETIYPVCGPASNVATTTMPTTGLCSVGTSTPGTTKSNTEWSWGCVGVNTDLRNDTVRCSAPKTLRPGVSSVSTSSITVLSPNGGETFLQGSTHNITWTSTNVNNVMIELYNLDVGWHLTYSTSALGGSYSWEIPSSFSVGSKYRIKIWDTTNVSVVDTSDNYFKIVSAETIYPVCGPASNIATTTMPTTGLCSVGSSVPGTTKSNTEWSWGCEGINTNWKDNTVWCSAPKTLRPSVSADGQNYATALTGFDSFLKFIQIVK
jgi:hypothetical protein